MFREQKCYKNVVLTRENIKNRNSDESTCSHCAKKRLNVDKRYDGPPVKHQRDEHVANKNNNSILKTPYIMIYVNLNECTTDNSYKK